MGYFTSYGGNVIGRLNAAAGTAYYGVIPGKNRGIVRVTKFVATCGNTANDVVILRPIGRANTTASAASGASAVTLDADPYPTGNEIAASDQVVILHSDGVYRKHVVNTSGWNGTTKVLTLSTTLGAAVDSGAKVWNFGVPADTDPVFGSAHPVFPTAVNTTTNYEFVASGVAGHQPGDPLLIYSANATNATVLQHTEFTYTRE